MLRKLSIVAILSVLVWGVAQADPGDNMCMIGNYGCDLSCTGVQYDSSTGNWIWSDMGTFNGDLPQASSFQSVPFTQCVSEGAGDYCELDQVVCCRAILWQGDIMYYSLCTTTTDLGSIWVCDTNGTNDILGEDGSSYCE
jgi:hypothetical protein